MAEHCAGLMERVSLETMGDGSAESVAMSEEEFREQRRHSILLLDSFTVMTPAWGTKEELADYQSILNSMEEMADVIKIAEASNESVLDYSVIYDGNDKCIFAVTGEIQSNQTNAEYDSMEYYEGDISVWAFYDGQAEKIEDSSSYDGYWMGSNL